jgi:flagellar motility protein MotE (MotC chaperone)
MRWPRPRLLPFILLGMPLLFSAKLVSLWRGVTQPEVQLVLPRLELMAEARASAPAPPARAPAPVPAAPPQAAVPEPPSAEQQAERALLEALRARRTALEQREQALAQREMLLTAAERRLGQRIEEMAALQRRLEHLRTSAGEREEAGWRQLVKTYEAMRPRDAAAIFDELEMPVLVQVVDRMREGKVAPVLGAMRPERARQLTAELARWRARPAEQGTP